MDGLTALITALMGYLVITTFEKAFVEPIMQGVGQAAFKRFAAPAWERLDELLALPGNLEQFSDNAREWIYKQVIPTEAKQQLNVADVNRFINYIIKDFDVVKHYEYRHKLTNE